MRNELPEGWAETKIGEISDRIHYGYTAKSQRKPIGTKLLRITDIQNNNVIWDNVPYCNIVDADKEKYLLKTNDLVFARTGATVGKSYLIPSNIPESVFASYLIRVILNQNISHKFIYNFFQTNKYWTQIKEGSAGIGQPNVNATKLSNINLPIPPLNEQNRIVNRIEELLTRLDAGVVALKQVQTLLKKYRQSVLKSAVKGKLTSVWRKQHKEELEPADKLLERIQKERKIKWEAEQLANFKAKGKTPPKNWQNKYKEPTPLDTSKLPELPDGWLWSNFNQLGEWNGGGTPSKRNPDFWKNGDIPWVSPKDMKVDYIESTIDYITLNAVSKSTTKMIPVKSLLFVVRSGILRHILPVAINNIECTVNQDLKALTVSTHINSKYVLLFSKAYNKDLLHSCSKDGTTVQSIETPLLYNYPIPLPPLKEQDKIIEEAEKLLSLVEKTEKLIESELKRSQSLRQSILKHAFEGKLVPQDPNDEPASILLERIKAEKPNPKRPKQLEIQ